jgi:hypothetical protein
MSRITVYLLLGIATFLTSCSGTTAPAATGDTYVSQVLPAGYEGALPVRNQLALGILELNQTAAPMTAEQAQLLIPLWQALRSTQESGGQATAEVNALLAQIESTLTPQQLSSIAERQLNITDLQTWASANGIQLGTNGGVPGQGMGLSPEARATKQAAEGMTSSSASGSKLSSALTDAVIASLEAGLP